MIVGYRDTMSVRIQRYDECRDTEIRGVQGYRDMMSVGYRDMMSVGIQRYDECRDTEI